MLKMFKNYLPIQNLVRVLFKLIDIYYCTKVKNFFDYRRRLNQSRITIRSGLAAYNGQQAVGIGNRQTLYSKTG
jgi:hypothetical protein